MGRALLVGYDLETVDYSDPALPPGRSADKISAAPSDLRPAHQLPDRAARHRAPTADPVAVARRRRHRRSGRGSCRRMDPPHPAPPRLGV